MERGWRPAAAFDTLAGMTSRGRPTWPELPAALRDAVEARLGARVVRWASHDGGYSQGMASTLDTTDASAFVKAVGAEHEFTQQMYRTEAAKAAALPDSVPAPRFRWLLDEDLGDAGRWVAVAFDAVAGRPPKVPWSDGELQLALRLARQIGEVEPLHGALPDYSTDHAFGEWDELADRHPPGLASYGPWVAGNIERLASVASDWRAATAGAQLVHADLRGDNMLVIDRGRAGPAALAVDWPFAARGAGLIDVVAMLPAVRLEGGPPPADVLARHPLGPQVDPDAVTCYLAALTGFFVHRSLEPEPPGIPHVRGFQRAQAEVCIPWLRHRLGE